MSSSTMTVQFLGLGRSRNIRLTFNSKAPLSRDWFSWMNEWAKARSAWPSRLWAFLSHPCPLKELNLINLSMSNYTIRM